MESRRDVFQAIVDPNRRAILDLLSKKTLTLNNIAENFDVSRSAVSQHIKILTECGLIVVTQKGRERYCEARFDQLMEVSQWIEQYRIFWNGKLNALENFLDKDHKKKKKKVKSKH